MIGYRERVDSTVDSGFLWGRSRVDLHLKIREYLKHFLAKDGTIESTLDAVRIDCTRVPYKTTQHGHRFGGFSRVSMHLPTAAGESACLQYITSSQSSFRVVRHRQRQQGIHRDEHTLSTTERLWRKSAVFVHAYEIRLNATTQHGKGVEDFCTHECHPTRRGLRLSDLAPAIDKRSYIFHPPNRDPRCQFDRLWKSARLHAGPPGRSADWYRAGWSQDRRKAYEACFGKTIFVHWGYLRFG
jgi:hypothetical protein